MNEYTIEECCGRILLELAEQKRLVEAMMNSTDFSVRELYYSKVLSSHERENVWGHRLLKAIVWESQTDTDDLPF